MEIEVTCKAADVLPLEKLEDFQGNLKALSTENLNKLKKSLIKYGITAPKFVWQNGGHNWLLDGHQTVAALQSLQDEGYKIPLIPVAYIYAETEKEAKEKLLHISSQYGEFDKQEFLVFTQDLSIGNDTIRLLCKEFKINGNESHAYTAKVKAPIYEIKGERPKPSELYDDKKAKELIKNIKDRNLDKKIESFLIKAAGRHVVFNYGKIAEFYANETKDVQELMEASALVIVDFDKAIENGFVKLTERFEKVFDGDYNEA